MIRVIDESLWLTADLLTHGGNFHADDVFSTVFEDCILCDDDKEDVFVCRTRDENIIKEAMKNLVVVYDVGGEYDAEAIHFDHHQKGFDERRANGIKYASAGLIWRHYGVLIAKKCMEGIVLSEKSWENVAKTVDRELIEGIDAFDNGEIQNGAIMSVPKMIQLFNPTPMEIERALDGGRWLRDYAFEQACNEARRCLERTVESAVSAELERHEIITALCEVPKGQCYLPLKRELSSWVSTILELSAQEEDPFLKKLAAGLSFVVFPKSEDEWCVQAIPPSTDNLFGQRESFPESWRGLRGEQFADEAGVEGAFFCHPAGFFAKADTKECAEALAVKAHELNSQVKV